MRRIGLAVLFLCVFALCFAIGYFDRSPSSPQESVITSFNTTDEARILEEIQSHFTEPIAYQRGQISDLTTNDEGTSYYTMTYLVCVPSSDQVYMYLYYKFVTDSPEYQAGDVVCLMNTISNVLTKADVFPNGLG